MAEPYRTKRRVEFADTDMAGMMHFSNFFRYMESAEVEFLRQRGFSVTVQKDGQPFGLPRVSATCDYLKPARFQDLLGITVRVSNIGRKSVTYAFEFSKDDEVIARGQISAVCCKVAASGALESIELPPEFRKALAAGL